MSKNRWRVRNVDASSDVDVLYGDTLVGFYRTGKDWRLYRNQFMVDDQVSDQLVSDLLHMLEARVVKGTGMYYITSVPPARSVGQARMIAEMAVARLNELEEVQS